MPSAHQHCWPDGRKCIQPA